MIYIHFNIRKYVHMNIHVCIYICIRILPCIYIYGYVYTGGEAGEDLEWFARTSELFTFKGL
jgi:hypothetical protein